MSEAPRHPEARSAHAPKWNDFVTHRALLARLFGPPAWKSTLRDANLPEPAAGVVFSVCTKAKLWKGETNDVARELCAHFQDGLASGRSAEELARDFGDPVRTAKLIRRSKKRTRPLAWRMYAWSLRSIVVLLILGILFYGYAAARLYMAKPTIARNFSKEFNATVLAHEDDRAWPIYKAAIVASPTFPWTNNEWPANWPDVRPGEADYARAVAYWKQCGPFLAEIRRGAAKPISGMILTNVTDAELATALSRRNGITTTYSPETPDENPDFIGVLLPHLGHLREFSRLLIFDTREAVREGDGARVAANIDAMLGMAHQAGNEPFLISQLVAYAILSVASQETMRVVDQAPQLVSDADLARLAHRFATCIHAGRYVPTFEAERWMFEDALQRMFSDDGRGNGRITAEGMKLLGDYSNLSAWSAQDTASLLSERNFFNVAKPVLGEVMASRKETKREYDRMLGQASGWGTLDPWVRLANPPGWLGEQQALYDDLGWKGKYTLISVLMPALNHAYWVADTAHLERLATATMLACEVQRRRTGAWPASLEELVPGILPMVPRDIFDGKPLRYRLVDGKPMLYSIGHDMVDDGGKRPAGDAYMGGQPPSDQRLKGDWIFFPRLVELPRPAKSTPGVN